MNRLVIFLFLAVSLFAQVPTIGSITVTTDTNAAVVSYTVSGIGNPFCFVRYGVASGTYLWSSESINQTGASPQVCANLITGLKDGTTYYFLPTARPDPDDETNICAAASCGAVEQSAATPPATVSHWPTRPQRVAPNLLSEPDTTGYAIVNLAPTGAGGECVATAAVSPPEGYTVGVGGVQAIATNDTLTAILNASNGKLWYGTVFQVPQGVNCTVIPSVNIATVAEVGYSLSELPIDPLATGGSIDAANHRWIIFRTIRNSPTDFPPFGVRLDPNVFGNRLGGFQSINPCVNCISASGTLFNYGDSGSHAALHHLWFENLKFSVDDTQATAVYGNLFMLGNGEGGATPPFPEYIVFRANYLHGANRPVLTTNAPSINGWISGTFGGQVAIVDNYADNLWWGGQGINQGFYFMDCGSGGNCNTGGPVLIDNNYEMGMGQNIYLEENNFMNPTSPHDFTITHNSLYFPPVTLTYAQWIHSTYNFYGNRQQIEFKGGQRIHVRGNYINGQWASSDPGEPLLVLGTAYTSDFSIVSNYFTNCASWLNISGEANDEISTSRISSGNRFFVSNNLAYNLGRGYFNAGGGGIGAPLLSIGTPLDNLTVSNNTIVGPFTDANFFYPWVLNFNGDNNGPVAGLTFTNNIAPFGAVTPLNGAGINTEITLSAGGALSHPSTPIGIDSSIWTNRNFTAFLQGSFGYTDGASGLGLQGITVINPGSGYPNTGKVIFTGCGTEPTATFSALNGAIIGNGAPAVQFSSFGSGCNPAAMTATADTSGGGRGAVLRPSYGLTPSYRWGGNIMVCTDLNGVDMTDSECSSVTSTMPAGDLYVSGGNTALRLAAAGLANSAVNDFRCFPTSQSPCSAGASIPELESALGIVSNIAVSVGSTNAAVNYTAPDNKACYVDTSPDGATWTRWADSGGNQARSLTIAGLTPGTTYQYRLMCYFDQSQAVTAGWFSFPSDPSNLATDGSFTTAYDIIQ